MTIARRRLIHRNTTGTPTRSLVEMAIDKNANEPHPATAKQTSKPATAAATGWGDAANAESLVLKICQICGSKKIETDAQRLTMVEEALAAAKAAANQSTKPKAPLIESALSELIESQRSAASRESVYILPGGRFVKIPAAMHDTANQRKRPRLNQQSR